ncbi:MAG: SOS response-associated peptidase [Kiritimatiellales bacterium]|nr:SOS response-associated peptidase [Kiritimatiellales bacterium]MCF7863192.1 SOS response-associated peptidase [Kiritimatiellales bacterium]
MLEQLGEIELPPLFHGRYNIAPTQTVAMIRQAAPNRVEAYIWGFANPKSTAPVINARTETLNERPMFKDLITRNRCLVPADGFYEWKGKEPYYFQLPDKSLFAFAGLWRDDRCVVITRAADANMRGIHHRMPVIVPANLWWRYFDDFQPLGPAPTLVARPVSRRVNKVSNDDPTCLEPADEQIDLSLFPDGE